MKTKLLMIVIGVALVMGLALPVSCWSQPPLANALSSDPKPLMATTRGYRCACMT